MANHRFFFQKGWLLLHFRFIEEILLSWNVIGFSFAGRTEKHFGKMVYLFLESFLMTGFFVDNKMESFVQFSLFSYPLFLVGISYRSALAAG